MLMANVVGVMARIPRDEILRFNLPEMKYQIGVSNIMVFGSQYIVHVPPEVIFF